MGTMDALGPRMINSNSKPSVTKIAVLFFALLAGSISGCALEEDDPSYTPPNISTEVCCDCACSDGADICVNLLERAPAGSSCDTVCEVQCSEQDACSEVDEAQVCAATPPQPCATGAGGDEMQPCA